MISVFIIKINFILKFIAMNKEKSIQTLKHKIAELEKKIENSKNLKVSNKKIENLEFMKLKYEDELVGLVNE